MALAAAGCAIPGQTASPPGPGVCRELAAAAARTPPPVELTRPAMGFDPYNTFGTVFDQHVIVAIVRAMARSGMRAAGYRYVILDDGWQGRRTSSGTLTADPRRFPCGIKRLAEFVHGEGFDFGIYTTPALRSCGGRPGSADHEKADARTFASWGVDYVKLDWCNSDYSPAGAAAIARRWRAALDATHRPMILSINAGGSPAVGQWAHTIVNSWRVGGDICGSWYNQTRPPSPTARGCYDRVYQQGIVDYLTSPGVRAQVALAGPGHFIDPDMLEVGTRGVSPRGQGLTGDALDLAEARTNFAIWAMWSAPLIAGNDPRAMSGTDPVSQILLNRAIIAIDQDPLGRPASLIVSRGGWQVWRKQLTSGRTAVAVVNLADTPAAIDASWAQLGISARPASLRDLWAQRDLPVTGGLHVRLGAHATAVYLLGGRAAG